MAEAPGDDTPRRQAAGDHCPSLRELDQLPGLATIWYRLGLQLGVRADDLDVMEKNYPRDVNMCKIRMFAEWQRGDTNPTYEKLVRALANVGKRELAESVRSAQGISLSALDSTGDEETGVTIAKATIAQLQKEYKQLVILTQEAVERKSPTLQEFRTSITLQLPESIRPELELSLMEKFPFIYKAESIETIFGIFNLSVWSYLSFGLLQHLVDIYGEDELQQRMLKYTTSVESFRKETTLKVFWKAEPTTRKCPEISSKLRASLIKLEFKHGNLDETTTLEDIERCRQDLAQEYSFPTFTIILADIKNGCVATTWLVPPSLAAKLEDETKKGGNVSFLEQHKILRLQIQGTTVYCDALQLIKEELDSVTECVEEGSEPLEAFCGRMTRCVDDAMEKIDKIKHSKVTRASGIRPCSQELKIAVEKAYSFVDKVDDFTYYCSQNDIIATVIEAVRRDDFEPLEGLVDQLLRSISQAEQFYMEFQEACKAASRNASDEAERCQPLAIEAQNRRKKTLAIGGMAAAGALGGGVALSVIAGLFTFGIGSAIGLGVTAGALGAGGVATGVATGVIAKDFKDAEKALKELARIFNSLASGAFSLYNSVLRLHTVLEGLATVLKDVDMHRKSDSVEPVCTALERMHSKNTVAYTTTSRCRNSIYILFSRNKVLFIG